MNILKQHENSPLARDLFGLHFPNPFGFTACKGPVVIRHSKVRYFSFVEIGPITSVEEPVSDSESILDKLKAEFKAKMNIKKPVGESLSVREAISILKAHKPRRLIAANLAPSRLSIDGKSITHDIVTSFNYMYDFADMFIIDTFHKNANGSTPLQNVDLLSEVLDAILKVRISNDTFKPIFIRVESTIQEQSLIAMLDYMRYSGVEAIIAGFNSAPYELVKKIVGLTQGRYPVIACGDIHDADDAQRLLDAGACLLQIDGNCKRILKTLEKNIPTK